MAFTFIHSADWQLGKPYGTFPSSVEPVLQAARLSAIDRLAKAATSTGARHVIVAGDMFDSMTASNDLIQKTLAHTSAHPGLTWHLLPGNHDPAQPGSVWAKLSRHPRLGAVRLHVTATPAEIEPGIWLLPAPLKSKAMSTDPTAWMDACQTPAGHIRIGIAHGSVRGFNSSGEAAIPIDPARDRLAQLDYLALGDWHGQTRIGERTWYSGTPEPDRFKDNEAGVALSVTIPAAGATPTVTVVPTGLVAWLDRSLTVRDANSFGPLLAELANLGAPARPVLLKLTLSGVLPLAAFAAIEAQLEALAGRALHVATDRRGLRPAHDTASLHDVFAGSLAVVAARIGEQSNADQSAAQQSVSARALQMLADFAHRESH